MAPPLPRRTPLLGVLALLGAVGCGERARDGAAPAPPEVPGVVLICIDTLRADAITLSPGSPAGPMPALEAFAREGTAFSDATTTAPWTAPAVASVLSGLDAGHTGVSGREAVGTLSPSVRTLAERLAERGWSTAAYTSGGWIVAGRGYAQGFEAFHATFDAHGPETCIANWRRARPEGKPFFLFLHTYSAHDPYGPKVADETGAPVPTCPSEPEAMVAAAAHRRTADATGRMAPASALWFLEHALTDASARTAIGVALGSPSGVPTRAAHPWSRILDVVEDVDPADPERVALAGRLRSAYAAGLAETDRVLARTLAALRAAGVTPETPIVVVGDHGEAFGEHEAFTHARFLYDEHLRVPLLVRAPGRFPTGRVVAGSCGVADVAPTILRLAGVDASDVDGRSLLPLARGEEPGHVVLAEETLYPADVATAVRRRSVRTEAAKYLLTVEFATRRVIREEVFDLRLDPGERTPLALEAVSCFGADFCRAVERLREATAEPGAPSPCVLTAVR